MNRQTLAAALNLAYAVSAPDGLQEQEAGAIMAELASFKLPSEENAAVLNMFNEMSLEDAIEIIRNSDDDTKDEAQALMIVTVCADKLVELSEQDAFLDIYNRCGFTNALSYDDAVAKLGFYI